MKKRLLITGSSGFLGYHLIEGALLQDYEVYAGVRKSSNTKHLQQKGVTIVELDLSDTNSTKNILKQHGINYIIHAAAQTKAKTEQEHNYSNAVLTRNLAMAAAEAQTDFRKFVFISSLAALGPSADGKPVDENTVPRPLTWYGKSKLLAEQYLSEINHFPFIGLRPTAVYGPREKDLLTLVKMVNNGFEIYIGSKPQKLSFVYVKDVVAIALAGLESEINGEFYNVGDGKVYNQYSYASVAKKILKKKIIRLHLPLPLVKGIAATMEFLYTRSSKAPVLNRDKMKELTAENWSLNIAKAQRDLNYQPAYDLESGLEETISWYKTNNWI